jgi:diguanylate cyclase (GGDEF)-like protein/PAS domain S-box-containing protein
MSYFDTSDLGLLGLFQRLPIACMLLRVSDNRVLAINKAFEDLFGWQEEDIASLTIEVLPLWNSLDQRRRMLDILAGGASFEQCEAHFKCRDGRVKPCLIYGDSLELDGETCRLLMAHDIGDRISSEEALKRSEAKFAALFQGSPEPYVLFEKRTARILEINRSFTEMFGYQPEDILGKTAAEIGLWRYPEKRAGVIAKLLRDKFLRNEPVDLLARDRRVINCEVSSNFVLVGDEVCTLSSFKDVTERRKIEDRIKHQAFHDSLTGLPNRALLYDRILQHIAVGERHGLSCALLFFDLDYFKRINDSLGHGCGDAVLQEISRRLLKQVRKADTVARLGGDEFVVLLTGFNGSTEDVSRQAYANAASLLAVVAAPMEIEGHSLQLGCSIGVALLPQHGETPEELLKHADTALYGVKATGRNNIAFFEPQMQVLASQRLLLENQLRQAISQQEFCLYYQPQIDSRSNRIIGAEALLRWRHPEKGLIGPGSFMPVLEESAMIISVGQWVLQEACAFLRRLLDAHLVSDGTFSVSINISPRQFRQADLVQQVAAAVQGQGVPASGLKLEITEGIVIQNIADTVNKMRELRAMGVCFAIDDFGTGYSSLSYLKRLPVDLLKIDQSFIRDCARDGSDAEIVRAIISMARSLNLEIIAEGVETPEQLAFLQKQNCHAYQGYHFSPALTEETFRGLLAQFLAAEPRNAKLPL